MSEIKSDDNLKCPAQMSDQQLYLCGDEVVDHSS